MMMSDGLSAALVAEKLEITVGSVYTLKKRVTDKLYREINRLDRELN
jgi:DNA-binding CsgD family transcriptional regulator